MKKYISEIYMDEIGNFLANNPDQEKHIQGISDTLFNNSSNRYLNNQKSNNNIDYNNVDKSITNSYNRGSLDGGFKGLLVGSLGVGIPLSIHAGILAKRRAENASRQKEEENKWENYGPKECNKFVNRIDRAKCQEYFVIKKRKEIFEKLEQCLDDACKQKYRNQLYNMRNKRLDNF